MNLRDFAKPIEKLVADNSPTILTGIGVIGTVATAYLTGKASFKAADILSAEQRTYNAKAEAGEPDYTLTKKDKFKLTWSLYTAAVGVATLTCTAIVMSNRISTRRAAALATAFTLAERAHTEYKDKVLEHFGVKKEQEVKDAVAKDKVDATSENQVFVVGESEQLCMDAYTGRYFKSTMEDIKAAQNHINNIVNRHGYASLNDFYSWIDLENVPIGEEVGWNGGKLMDISFSPIINNKNQAVLVLNFQVEPTRSFNMVH